MSFMSAAYPTMTPPTRKSQLLQPCAAGWASQNARPERHSDRDIKTHQDSSRPLTRKHDRYNEWTSRARNVSCTVQLTLDFAYTGFFKLFFYHVHSFSIYLVQTFLLSAVSPCLLFAFRQFGMAHYDLCCRGSHLKHLAIHFLTDAVVSTSRVLSSSAESNPIQKRMVWGNGVNHLCGSLHSWDMWKSAISSNCKHANAN